MSSEHGTSPPLNTAHNFHIDDDDSMRVLGSIATSSIELILGQAPSTKRVGKMGAPAFPPSKFDQR